MIGKKRKLCDGSIYDHIVYKMPSRSDCYVHWISVQSVRIRTLFEAIQHVIYDGVLLFQPRSVSASASIAMAQHDNSKTMVVYVNLNEMDSNTCSITRKMRVGINTKEFFKMLKGVTQNDVVGMCIEKHKWDTAKMCLDVYVMNQNNRCCYVYECKSLALEYVPIAHPVPKIYQRVISIDCANFKRFLNDCALHGEYVKFTNIFHRKQQMVETKFTPVRGSMKVANLSLSYFSPESSEFVESKTEHEFSIASLRLFAKKGAALCQNARLLLDDTFPVVVEYDVGTLGSLRFQLARRVNHSEVSEEPAEAAETPLEEDFTREISRLFMGK